MARQNKYEAKHEIEAPLTTPLKCDGDEWTQDYDSRTWDRENKTGLLDTHIELLLVNNCRVLDECLEADRVKEGQDTEQPHVARERSDGITGYPTLLLRVEVNTTYHVSLGWSVLIVVNSFQTVLGSCAVALHSDGRCGSFRSHCDVLEILSTVG